MKHSVFTVNFIILKRSGGAEFRKDSIFVKQHYEFTTVFIMRNPLRIIEKNRQIRTFQSEIPEIPDFRRTHRSLCKTPVPFPQIPIEMKANKHAETPKTTYPWTRTSFVHVLQARFTIISFLSPRSIRPEHFPVEKFISSFCSAARRQFGIHLPDEIADQVHGFAHSRNFTLEKAKV